MIKLSFALFYFLCQLRKNGQRISYNTKICNREDRSVLIFINGDDIFGAFHACNMLNSTADTGSNVEAWFYRLACLSDLIAIRQPASINNGTGCAGGTAGAGSGGAT